MKPTAVNYHLIRACDADCRFCFATFRDVPGQLPLQKALRLVELLAAAGAEKLTFAGGEPTLQPHLGALVQHAKRQGLATCVVTNGLRLASLLSRHSCDLDWVGLSVDSSKEDTQAALGRGRGDHVARAISLSDLCRSHGVRVKLNTVVTALTVDEDLSELVRRIGPERWKVFQVLPMAGQNDGRVDDLLITARQFQHFLGQHAHLHREGFGPVVEDNDAMRGSYVMVDPIGRFFGNATGTHVYSQPILDIGVQAALAQVDFDPKKFIARGGEYEW